MIYAANEIMSVLLPKLEQHKGGHLDLPKMHYETDRRRQNATGVSLLSGLCHDEADSSLQGSDDLRP